MAPYPGKRGQEEIVAEIRDFDYTRGKEGAAWLGCRLGIPNLGDGSSIV